MSAEAWARRFRNLEELRQALLEFRQRYNHHWILERLDYQTPYQALNQTPTA